MTNHVYLVDDDEAVRHALSLLLETVGLTVRSFALPESFLAQAAKLPKPVIAERGPKPDRGRSGGAPGGAARDSDQPRRRFGGPKRNGMGAHKGAVRKTGR